MPAPNAAAIQRTSFRGIGAIVWCPTVANTASPTRTEINAGTNFTGHVQDGSGFGLESDLIDTPDAASRITSQIPGTISIDESSFTVYAALLGVDMRQLQPRDALGFILIMPGGDVPGRKMDVWPVRVASNKKQYSFGGGDADTLVIKYAPGTPSEDVTIPA